MLQASLSACESPRTSHRRNARRVCFVSLSEANRRSVDVRHTGQRRQPIGEQRAVPHRHDGKARRIQTLLHRRGDVSSAHCADALPETPGMIDGTTHEHRIEGLVHALSLIHI